MPQSYSAEILRLELQFIHCVFSPFEHLCIVRYILSRALQTFLLYLDIHLPTNPTFQKFHRKNRSAGFKTFEAGHFHASEQPLGLSASESSVSRGLLAPVELRESRALNTGLFIKLCYVLCVNFTCVAFCNRSR